MALSEQRKRFCDYYFETLKGSESAIKAGFSEASAKQIAWNLLQEPEIEEYLHELRSKSERKHSISRDRWLAELEACGFSNIQDYLEDDLNPRPLGEIQPTKASAISGIKRSVTTFDGGEKETVEFKLHDKLNALDKIGRHFGYYEVDNEQSRPVITWQEQKTYDSDQKADHSS